MLSNVIKENKWLIGGTTGMNLRSIMLSGIKASYCTISFMWHSGKDNTIGTAENWVLGEDSYSKGTPGSLGVDGNALYLDCGNGPMTAHICQSHPTASLKRIKFATCKLKLIFFFKSQCSTYKHWIPCHESSGAASRRFPVPEAVGHVSAFSSQLDHFASKESGVDSYKALWLSFPRLQLFRATQRLLFSAWKQICSVQGHIYFLETMQILWFV